MTDDDLSFGLKFTSALFLTPMPRRWAVLPETLPDIFRDV